MTVIDFSFYQTYHYVFSFMKRGKASWSIAEISLFESAVIVIIVSVLYDHLTFPFTNNVRAVYFFALYIIFFIYNYRFYSSRSRARNALKRFRHKRNLWRHVLMIIFKLFIAIRVISLC